MSFDFLSEYSWNSSNSESNANSIGTKKPSPIGLFDVLGNAYEAVIGEDLDATANVGSTLRREGLGSRTILNIRGGSFLSSRIFCASGSHHHIPARATDVNAGFRIVRTLRPSQ